MSDSEEDYEEESGSEGDDEDYIPDEASDEDDIDFEPNARKRRKTTPRQRTSKRRRRRGIRLEDQSSEEEEEEEEEEEFCGNDEESEEEEEPNFEDEDENEGEDENNEGEGKKTEEEEKTKSRVDNLWAEFKKDTSDSGKKEGGKKEGAEKEGAEKEGAGKDAEEKADPSEKPTDEKTPSNDTVKKVEVTETYDFAGEEVKVVKKVDAPTLAESENQEDATKASDKSNDTPVVVKKQAAGGLGSVLGKLGKKTKLSTLEKSKLDWDSFKKDEGIEDDLKTSNKDGYLEKKAFLQRVDEKQFEIERDIREAGRKK